MEPLPELSPPPLDAGVPTSADCRLPVDKYALLVHRPYVSRVCDALRGLPASAAGWTAASPLGTPSRPAGAAAPPAAEVFSAPDGVTGPRSDRRGYDLVVVPTGPGAVAELNPLARRNVSWACRLTHAGTCRTVPAAADAGAPPYRLPDGAVAALLRHVREAAGPSPVLRVDA
eukprot:CAMPEP_0194272856 /NCGR_PEP_ID=MMETSP0169-20130528/6321_1 /TAXON_ID=218684 /ORGANISM="Corethron pennatum, Strain L29A3" /LENGTH=172 /DNA_ID=CAMNT_0039015629 /DNA_START=51 /DNA_END=566 /DNA_ORIENTATION=-